MSVETLIQYLAMFISIMALIIMKKGMKKFVPVAMFASLYANLWCYIAKYYKFWSFPVRIFPIVKDISIPVNVVVVPIIAMFWVRYYPTKSNKKLFWALSWTTVLIVIEVLIGKFTNLIEYSNGFKWYHSYVLWFLSLYIWRGFHHWIYD
ncbi:CBO0543 family protein [Wukongibacter baidiensis]|uniref:CBO0543 family protein n=1 Tax=Wukongibacter baidiensis TaxID=1723361 RepID=UPI003D7F5E44